MPRLVIFELHHLGDAVMTLPLLRGARRKFSVTIVCRPSVGKFLRAAIPEIEVVDAAEDWPARASQARKFRCGQADFTTCVWADTRAQVLMALTGAGNRLGFPMSPQNYYAAEVSWRKRRLATGQFLFKAIGLFLPLLTHSLTRTTTTQHHMEDWKQLGEALQVIWDDSPPWIENESSSWPELTDFLSKQQGRRIVLVHPGGRFAEKRWPRFPELINRLAGQTDIAVLIVAAPGEPTLKPTGKHQRIFSSQCWPKLFAIFSAADAVVCNDSAAAHLAAAMGKPVVSIFGSGNPDWFSPWGNRHLVVVPEGKKLYPIIEHGAPPGSIHLDAIPVELVESRLRTALNAG